MARNTRHTANLVTRGNLGKEVASYVRSLKKKALSPNTISSYERALHQLEGFLAARGSPTGVPRIDAAHLQEWIAELVRSENPAIAHTRFRDAQRFFGWYAETHESFASPMSGMRPPKLPDYQRVLGLDQQKDLLRACQGKELEDLRDMALIRVFLTTDAPRAEIANLRYSSTDPAARDLHLDRGTARFSSKGGRARTVRLDKDTVAALAAYVKARRGHPHADLPWLWLGKNGRLTDSGVGRALRDRGVRAGIPGLHRLNHGLWAVQPGH